MGDEQWASAWRRTKPQRAALRSALLAPLQELIETYRRESEFVTTMYQELSRVMDNLVAQRPDEEAVQGSEPASAPPLQQPGVELRVIDTERLLDFIDNLGNVPGVGRISVISPGPGRATLLVELINEQEPPHTNNPAGNENFTIVCAGCGKVLEHGGPEVSHTFCDECVQRLLAE